MRTIASYQLLTLLAISLLVSACSGSGAKIGSTVKGTRIAVMENKTAAKADKDESESHPQLPDMQVNHDWPQSGQNVLHVMAPAQMAAQPSIAWQTNIGSGSDSDYKLLAPPIVQDDIVYTMDAQGIVTATSAKDGDTLWDFDTTPEETDDNAIGGGLAIDGQAIYAANGFGEILAMSAKDGRVLWRKSLLVPVRAAPTIADGRVYAVTIDNQLSALDTKTGDILWQHRGIAESATLMGAASPAVDGDNVVVAYSSGEIYCLRAENGRVLWNYALTTPTQVGALPAIADIRGLPVVDHGRVYAVSHSGRIAAIDLRTGDRDWEADIGGIHTPAVTPGWLFVLSNDRQLLALDRDNGRIAWVHDMQKLVDPTDNKSDPLTWVGPVVAGGRLWLANSVGKVVSFNTTDGSEQDSVDVDEPVYIAPIVASGTMYVLGDEGDLFALR
ncbi:MAG: PQQ-binding-like beta-propeller repeat protein [Alphaproteobacteria bacterium]|nr:PQQ-binding-like beta-propeller repeat protein [Alphaproteobacteria bacterium]